MHARSLVPWISLFAASCLDPLADDAPTFSPDVKPPGSALPWATDDPAVAERVSNADGISASPVPRRVGYAAGEVVRFWDLGTAPRTTAPMWLFRRCGGDAGRALPGEAGSVAHPNVFESIPGDRAYTPFHTLWLVCVTDRYAGEVIVSRRGLADAIALGLVVEPVPLGLVGAFPMTLPEIALDVADGAPPAGPLTGYYEGTRASYFHIGGEPAGLYEFASALLKPARVYRLVKEDDEAFEQVVFSVPRRVDGAPNPAYVPLWQIVEVTMAATYADGGATAEAQLFTITGAVLTPVHPEIASFVSTETLVHWEIQYAEGSP